VLHHGLDHWAIRDGELVRWTAMPSTPADAAPIPHLSSVVRTSGIYFQQILCCANICSVASEPTILHADLTRFMRQSSSGTTLGCGDGGARPRGVLAASYEARALASAPRWGSPWPRRLCPQAVVVDPAFGVLGRQQAVFEIFDQTTR
jgi:hypothetical protein